MATQTIELTLLGKPQPKQSFRYAKSGHRYQTSAIINATQNIRTQVMAQLPEGFEPFRSPIIIHSLDFVFQFRSREPKWRIEAVRQGEVYYKKTKPDIDNLQKLLFDALSGLVLKEDSLICSIKSIRKVYGFRDETIIKLGELDEY